MIKSKTTDIPDDHAWIREVREKIYEETKHMTHEEFSEYVRKGVADFDKDRQRIRKQKTAANLCQR